MKIELQVLICNISHPWIEHIPISTPQRRKKDSDPRFVILKYCRLSELSTYCKKDCDFVTGDKHLITVLQSS